MVFNRFAAGRKVYGQGSFAPSRGQNNPQGYIQREIKRRNQEAGGVSKVGNDGQSDTRSGLAANALRNGIRKPQPPRTMGADRNGATRTGASFGSQAVAQGQGTRKPPSAVGTAPGFDPSPAGNSGGGNAPVSVGPDPASQSVAINPTGQLQLPYNSEFANMALDAQMQFDAEMQALAQEEQGYNMDYERNARDLEQGYQTQQRGTLNNNGSSGTLFSSTYGTGVNEDARMYTNTKNDMEADRNFFQQGIASRRNTASTALNTLIQRAVQGYADSLAAEAGNLGFGVDEASPSGAPAASGGGNGGNGGNKGGKKGKNNWLTPTKAGKNPTAVALSQKELKEHDKKKKKGKK